MNAMTKRMSVWAVVVAAILSIPLLANAPWTVGDFIFAGGVLFGAATVFELSTRNMTSRTHRIAAGVAVLAVLVLIWAWAVAGPDSEGSSS